MLIKSVMSNMHSFSGMDSHQKNISISLNVVVLPSIIGSNVSVMYGIPYSRRRRARDIRRATERAAARPSTAQEIVAQQTSG
jgi:hypothetical protein